MDSMKPANENRIRILVVCTGNSCRSQMAAGLLKTFDNSLEVFSAGISPEKSVSSFAILAMKQLGIDLSGEVPKSVNVFLDKPWDYVITLSKRANSECPGFLNEVRNRMHILFDDPMEASGSDDTKLNEYCRVRDEMYEAFRSFYNTFILKSVATQSHCCSKQ